MSATAPLRRPAALRLPAVAEPAITKPVHARPRLVLVSQRRPTAGRLPFLIVVGAVMVMGLVGMLLLHMAAAQDAYRANALQTQLATLHEQEQALASQIEADSSPAVLRQRAADLGMRKATVEKFHRLKDGRAVGLQTPVYVPPPAPVVTKTDKSNPTTKSKAATDAKAGTDAKTSTDPKTGTDPKSNATADKPKTTKSGGHKPNKP